MRRQQENLTLANGNIVKVAFIDDLEQHVAFELVKKFLHRIVVIVGALVRPADDLHGHLAVLEHFLVADRRLEQVPVLVDPFLKVEGVQSSLRHGLPPSSRTPTSAEASYLIRLVTLSTIGLGVA